MVLGSVGYASGIELSFSWFPFSVGENLKYDIRIGSFDITTSVPSGPDESRSQTALCSRFVFSSSSKLYPAQLTSQDLA